MWSIICVWIFSMWKLLGNFDFDICFVNSRIVNEIYIYTRCGLCYQLKRQSMSLSWRIASLTRIRIYGSHAFFMFYSFYMTHSAEKLSVSRWKNAFHVLKESIKLIFVNRMTDLDLPINKIKAISLVIMKLTSFKVYTS